MRRQRPAEGKRGRPFGESAPDAPGRILIGVDGGGTRSRALVADEQGQRLAVADGGPALIDPIDPTRAVQSVIAVVGEAAAKAGVALPVQQLWAGLAGASQSGARTRVAAALSGAGLAAEVTVGSDIEAAHADAFGDGPGILCVVGTGSSVRGVGPSGERVRVGGWGHLLGDEGSGYRIGLDGLSAVMRASDGRGPPTSLATRLTGAAGVTEPPDLVGWAARASKGAIAALSVRVAEEARAGDAVAVGIVEDALAAIRAHLVAALRRLGEEGWEDRPVIAFVGGLANRASILHEAVATMAAELGCDLYPGTVVPERGAVRLARKLALNQEERAKMAAARTPALRSPAARS